ncbi:MAG: sigma-54-dependent Fis family transcriptional regulator [Williamsia sp.]|nr:sigma-54-dependent Fis family transcriptional regulator [Williamsia sp.]
MKQCELLEDLPFFVFAETIPDRETVDQVLHESYTMKNRSGQLIIIIEKNQPRKLDALWMNTSIALYDIIEWIGEEDLIEYVVALTERIKRIHAILESPTVKKNLIGESNSWKTFLKDVIEVALFSQVSVLLIGESGTGKELVSRLIHTIDNRQNKKDLVLVDCTTIVPELSGSEFFGHERGSYTNALQSREGAFALANEGTLFLDEVGEMPMHLQAELLRVIQEGTYKKVGSNAWRTTNFRLVCATNKDLKEQMSTSKFRQDLYFRIADFEFRMPSLRERVEDIPLLAKHFLRNSFPGHECPEFDDCVMEYLVNREYPGNVRELRQLIHRMAIKHIRYKKITPGEIPWQDRINYTRSDPAGTSLSIKTFLQKALVSGSNLWELKNMVMEEAIQIALDMCDGNKEMAAKKLGVTWRAILQFRKKQVGEIS